MQHVLRRRRAQTAVDTALPLSTTTTRRDASHEHESSYMCDISSDGGAEALLLLTSPSCASHTPHAP